MTPKELEGQRFGRLTVISQNKRHSGKKIIYWNCICDCGTNLVVHQESLLRGRSKSCGCLREELTAKRFTKHGESRTPLYQMYCAMVTSYRYHHEREHDSITLHWQTYEEFKQWAMSNGWHEGLKIVRLNKYKGFTPENCKFIDKEF